MLQAHILSMDMLRQVDEAARSAQAYSQPRTDFVFRMAGDARQEDFLKYYRSRVSVLAVMRLPA
jgi:capsule polysaccharide export protein KpsE/RkpR